jgi:hypothetical protein
MRIKKCLLVNILFLFKVTDEDILAYTAQRDAATVTQIAQIANQTQQALANLQETYKTSIQTSSKKIY